MLDDREPCSNTMHTLPLIVDDFKLKDSEDPRLDQPKDLEGSTPCKSDKHADHVDRVGSLMAVEVTLLLRKKQQRNFNVYFTIRTPSTTQ